MSEFIPKIPAEYLMPLNMNGLRGRMLRVPSANPGKRREFLFVYGHHASLERCYGFAQVLRAYGNVTVPDLPGFGGMDSFYKINERADLDTLADYLAAFIKLRYRNRRITLVGFSFGFLVLTRMLQRYPDLAARADLVISLEGFARHDDLAFKSVRRYLYLAGSWLFERYTPAVLFRNIALHPSLLKAYYKHSYAAADRSKKPDAQILRAMSDFEVHLWRSSEVRTYMKTMHELLRVDNCTAQLNLPVWHIGIKDSRYFNNELAEEHLATIYKRVDSITVSPDKRPQHVIASKKQAAIFFPRKLKNALNRM